MWLVKVLETSLFNIAPDPNLEKLCFLAFNECNYKGRCLSICGKFPDIPNPL